MIAWNFQRIVGTCQFRVPWFGYPCGYSSLTEHRPSEDMPDEQLEALTPWSKEVQNVCKNQNVVKRLHLAKMMQALIKI